MTWLLKILLFIGLTGCMTANGKESISTTTSHGFYVLTIDPSFYPKDTKKFELIFNGFFWHRYRVGEKIMLVKVKGLPNSVVLIPLDYREHHLGSPTEFVL